MSKLNSGDRLPNVVTPLPGPESRRLAIELRRHESPNVTFVSDRGPIVWREAVGANVLDVDGNTYIDLSAGFGVAATGHRNHRVVDALHRQLDRLVHGFGDVHPSDAKIEILGKLADITPGDLSLAILASSGAEAVEAALKTARLASDKPGVLSFTGAYHGLTYGTLAVTDRKIFRAPFEDQIGIPSVQAPYPDPYRLPTELQEVGDPAGAAGAAGAALDIVSALLETNAEYIGAVIVEPLQGRGGIVRPPAGFLTGLREICDRRNLVLIFDEIFTGMGRTGRWFACEHENVVPDLLCIGKALSGALPLSACIGHPEIMAAWPINEGTAIHTSTFLGHPLACAAALAQIAEIEERGLIARSAEQGERLHGRLKELKARATGVGDVRGLGMLAGIELVRDGGPGGPQPDPDRAAEVTTEALARGLIVLADGRHGNVLSLSPPLVITDEQLNFALNTLEDCLVQA